MTWHFFVCSPAYKQRFQPKCIRCGKPIEVGQKIVTHGAAKRGYYKTIRYCSACYQKRMNPHPFPRNNKQTHTLITGLQDGLPWWMPEELIAELIKEDQSENKK